MTNYPIPTGTNIIHLQLLCLQNLGRQFGAEHIPPLMSSYVTFNPDLTTGEAGIFNSLVTITDASDSFLALPNWSSYTPQQASDVIINNVLPGITTRTDIDTFVAGLPNTVAGMKTGLTQVAYSLLAVRDILVALAKAIVYIRNLLLNQ